MTQSDLYLKKSLIKHITEVINAGWISISDPVQFFRNPVRSGCGSELQNPVGTRSGDRIMFNTDAYQFYQSDSPTGKITPAVVLPLMARQTAALLNFGNAKMLCQFCLARQNEILVLTWVDQDWIALMIFKNFTYQDWI